MIWHQLWQHVLIVVLVKHRWRRQMNKLCSPFLRQRRQRHHGWPRSDDKHTLVCACASCVQEFAHFDAWQLMRR
jgi:hypothetical protein